MTALNTTEMNVIRWICILSVCRCRTQLRELVGLESVQFVIKKKRLKCYSQVERRDD